MLKRTGVAALLLPLAGAPALAQSASPGSAIVLDTITVEARRETAPSAPAHSTAAPASAPTAPASAPTAPAAQPAPQPDVVAKRFAVLPGGASLVPQQTFSAGGNPTLGQALAGTPGVTVQSLLGTDDQPRIQMRGSAQQSPAERGILILHDGLPINRADGSMVIGLADPRQAETIEVYRGYMANRLGATVLSGALNFVSPTGSSQPGTQVSVSGGSFGQINTAGQVGARKDNVDAFLQFDTSRRDGYRNYNASDRESFSGNVGVALSENVKTRFFMGYTELGFDIPGPLTKSQLYADPRQVATGPSVVGGTAINPGPNSLRDKPRRDADQFMVGNRTTAVVDAHLLDIAFGYTHTDDKFLFPISAGLRDTHGGDFTGVVRYAYNPADALLPLFETTAQYTAGSADRGYYLNQSGVVGALYGANELSAQTLSLFAGGNVPVWHQFVVSPSISYAYAVRDNTDVYRAATRPTIAYSPVNPTVLLPNGSVPTQDTSYSRRYSGWNPALALSYRPDALQTLYVAASHSFEPPTQDDLLAPLNGTPNSSAGRPNPASPALVAAAFSTPDLKAQTAVTVEGGWRGRADRVSWDAVAYYSWLDNELLSLRDVSGAPLAAINAGRTTHFGIELGTGVKLTDRLTARLAYTYQDFRFVDDPTRGNNHLGGIVPHMITAQLQYQATEAWMLQGAVRWSPAKVPVDNMNTLYADPYAVVDLHSEYQIDKTWRVFGEVTNLFNTTYAATTVIVDQARPDQAAFLPGDGRGFYAGVKAAF